MALLLGIAGCGGGGEPTPNSTTTPAPPPVAAQLVVGTAQSIDGGAAGNPVSLRVARSASGDGFAVWIAHDGTRRNLWANRYRAAAAAWGSPVNIEASNADIDDLDVAVDANGNAAVAWHEPPTGDPQLDSGVVMSARFAIGASEWATPVALNRNASQPRVASDATGAVLAVYVAREGLVRGRFFDPVSGTWQPEAAIEQNNTGNANGFGTSFGPTALLDGSGNALVAFNNGQPTFGLIASNYFSRSTRDWVFRLAPDDCGVLLGVVPGSLFFGGNDHIQLAASAGGDFLLAWQAFAVTTGTEIRIARFTRSTRTWSAPQTLVPGSINKNVQFRRNIGSDAAGNALLLWTETEGMRTVLNAMRVDPAGAASSAVQLVDGAVGGGAAEPSLAVDPQGNAIAIWQQFEGGRPDDGSRSNIAVNRFDVGSGAWATAVLAEDQPGDAVSPRASAAAGQALLGWIQAEGGINRVKALLQPLSAPVGQ